MHWLFPGSVDMGQVKVQAMHEEDFKHNYNLLAEAFAKNGIIKVNINRALSQQLWTGLERTKGHYQYL